MVSAFALFLSYVLGGITLLPLCAAALLGFLFYTSPVVHVPPKTGIPTVSSKSEDDHEPVSLYRAGWVTVRRTYEPTLNGNDGTYVSMLTSGYRSFMDNRSRDPRRSKPKDRFFGVLKQNILFLYEAEEQTECWAAIEVSAHDVVIYPEGNVDGELFVKRTAIQLKPRPVESTEKEKHAEGPTSSDKTTYDSETGKPLPWFLFAQVNSDKEDWYHSLVLASRLGSPSSAADIAKDRALFDPDDMARLVDGIDQQPDSIPMRWFNALLGRIFLAVYRTSPLEDYITSRIVRKLKRVKTPAMLSEIQVREVNVGASMPLFSKPMLKELTPDGDASMEVHVAYVGAVRITIETVATVSLGSRFKPYSVRLVLAVVLKELEGTLLVKMKKPPSNRVWFGFTSMPKMVLNVEPVVSTRQIKWSMVTSPIESRIREIIAESIVCPHMDDLSFFSTLPFPATSRGGIYAAALRRDRPDLNAPAGGGGDAVHAVSGDPGPKEEDVVGEDVPSMEGGAGAARAKVGEDVAAVSSVARDVGGEARLRIKGTGRRRRRSSEGDQLPDLQLQPTPPPAPSSSATSAKSGNSVSSLAGLASASLASWREGKGKDKDKAQDRERDSHAGGGGSGASSSWDKKKPTWFSKTSTNASSTPTPIPTPGTSSSSSSSLSISTTGGPTQQARANSRTSASVPSTVTGSSLSLEPDSSSTLTAGAPQEEISASRLRDLLTKRAESREREREKERERERANEAMPSAETQEKELEALGLESSVPVPPPMEQRKLSNLSLTAPAPSGAHSLPAVPLDASRPFTTAVVDANLSTSPSSSSTSLRETPPGPASAAPPLPNRPSFIKSLPPSPSPSLPPSSGASPSAVLPPPPPTRRFSGHTSSASVDSPSSTTSPSAGFLATWRTKASDKEALAASVAQAKESMRRWGAGWNARRTSGRLADAEGAGMAVETPIKEEEGQEGYRDYRARTKSGDSTPQRMPSPPRGRAASLTGPSSTGKPDPGHFAPLPSSPTTKLSTASAQPSSQPAQAPNLPSRAPQPPPSPTKQAGYKPAAMMQLPGIRDEGRRRRVREDHLGGGGATVTMVPKEGEEKEGKELEQKGNALIAQAAAEAGAIVPPPPPPAPAPATPHVEVEPPTPVDHQERPAAPPLPPRASPPAALPPRQEAPPFSASLSAPPALPPRYPSRPRSPSPSPASTLTHGASVVLPKLPPGSCSPGSVPAPAPQPATEGVEEGEGGDDELADEAGWGLEEESLPEAGAGGEGVDSKKGG
ncbi:hypothetical protein JCM1841_004280 [Sporobolomyces salmonicolor]